MASEQRCYLIELPLEIKKIIYNYIFNQPRSRLDGPRDKHRSAILSTCRSIYHEARPILLMNTYRIVITERLIRSSPDYLQYCETQKACYGNLVSPANSAFYSMLLEILKQLPKVKVMELRGPAANPGAPMVDRSSFLYAMSQGAKNLGQQCFSHWTSLQSVVVGAEVVHYWYR